MIWPVGVAVAITGTGLQAATLFGIGMVSLFSGHQQFSIAIGAGLAGYAFLLGLSTWWLGRGAVAARGPALAASLVNLITAVSFTGSAPLAWLAAGLAAISVVALALPGTTAGLRQLAERRVSPPDRPAEPTK